MARLIDADKLTEKLLHFACRLEDWNRPEQSEAVRAVAKGIKLEKTVDAVEVVHGHWIEHESAEVLGNWIISNFECSECHDWLRYDSNYCPNCGAKMDLEK